MGIQRPRRIVSGQIFWQLSIPLKFQYKYKPDAQARKEVPLKFPRLRVGLVFEWFSKHQKYLPHTAHRTCYKLVETIAHRPHGCLSPVGHAQFAKHMLDMLLDRFVADVKGLGNLFVR